MLPSERFIKPVIRPLSGECCNMGMQLFIFQTVLRLKSPGREEKALVVYHRHADDAWEL